MATIEQLYQMKLEEVSKWMQRASGLFMEIMQLKEEIERLKARIKELEKEGEDAT